MKSSPEFSEAPTQNHSFEARIRHDLMALPEVEFSSLVVHRIPDGICLEGVVTTSDSVDVGQIAKKVAGVNEVLNQLVMHPGAKPQTNKG